MALGVAFPENEDLVTFGRKNEMLVLLVGKLDLYKKAFGNYVGYLLKKSTEDLCSRRMQLQISRNALTHVMND